jgi:ribosomal protection tetracycline resistance protein
MRTLNLGILAHVDAGKTTLTERLLYAAGIIKSAGSVDAGTTQTDTLALERQRGITIKAAVVSFPIGDLTVNLIDTPGHPDFIAEVERALSVLDGAVLVVSAVEGVQAQTRVLFRTLQRLRLPTLLFINKIDRLGARGDAVLDEIAARLTPASVALGAPRDLGTRAAGFVPFGPHDAPFRARLSERLAEHDDALLAAYVTGARSVPYRRLRAALAEQSRRALLHPVLFGSAITGAGVEELTDGIRRLLPARAGDSDAPLAGAVFKVERGPAGEKIACARLFTGTLRTRDRVPFAHGRQAKVTAIGVYEHGRIVPRDVLLAGQIGRLSGLDAVQIGDAIGVGGERQTRQQFAPPTLETVVTPCHAAEKGALHAALAQLAEQDPLINLRQDDRRQELSVSLYGEVQKEVIQETLLRDFGLAVTFRETTTICVERLIGSGAAVELLRAEGNPFLAGVGLRVEPGAAGSGVRFVLASEVHGRMPAKYFTAVEETVRETLQQGLFGWQVIDCVVTMTHAASAGRHSQGHLAYDKSMSTAASDFRNLTPLVLVAALRQAGTAVCAPLHRFTIEAPADTIGALVPALARFTAVPRSSNPRGALCVLEGDLPAASVHALQEQLPALTRGEGVLETAFDRYEPVRGTPPTRPRWNYNPLDRKAYLLHTLRRV